MSDTVVMLTIVIFTTVIIITAAANTCAVLATDHSSKYCPSIKSFNATTLRDISSFYSSFYDAEMLAWGC